MFGPPRRILPALRAAETTERPSRQSLGIRRYFVACFGIATTAVGLALTVSALALMYAGRPVAEASTVDPNPAVYFDLVNPAVEFQRRETEVALAPDAGASSRSVGGADRTTLRLLEMLALDAAQHDPDNERTLHAFGLPSGLEAQPPAAQPDSTNFDAPEADLPRLPAVLPSALPAVIERAYPGIAVLRTLRNVNLTFYDCAHQGFCGNMANGRKVYQGAAACSYDLPFGTRFFIEGDPTGRIYRCEDRGLLANTWVDIFWYHPADGWSWQDAIGRFGTIHIVEWGQ